MAMHTWASVHPTRNGLSPREQVENILTHAWDITMQHEDLNEMTRAYVDEINTYLPEHIDVTLSGNISIDGQMQDESTETIQAAITAVEDDFGQLLSKADLAEDD